MPSPLVAVSLKMYFDRKRTLAYFDAVARVAWATPEVGAGQVRLAVFPDFLTVPIACRLLRSHGVLVGAQDLGPTDRGAYTGEVSGADLAELGVHAAEIGHAERRTFFGETDEMVADKCFAAAAAGLVPMVCVGERERTAPHQAAAECVRQAQSALARVDPAVEVWVAYEPHWAIGAVEPAPVDHVAAVCAQIRDELGSMFGNATVIYGGSAGPGLLNQLGSAVDGLFLGRFAHDPVALEQVVLEAATR